MHKVRQCQRAYLGCAPAGDGQLLHIIHGGVQVCLVLGPRLPPLILRLEVLPCSAQEPSQVSHRMSFSPEAGCRTLGACCPQLPPLKLACTFFCDDLGEVWSAEQTQPRAILTTVLGKASSRPRIVLRDEDAWLLRVY